MMRSLTRFRFKKKKQMMSDTLVETYMGMDRDKNEDTIRMMASFIRRIQFPVSDICGMQPLIKDIPKGSEIYHYAVAMNMCGTLLSEMVNNMRLFYTISSDVHDPENTPYIFTKKLISTWTTRTGQQRNGFTRVVDGFCSDIECVLTIEKGVPVSVAGDPSYTHFVLHNLMDNAIKFTPEGHVHANVRVKEVINNMATIEICVEDTGVGIPHTFRERVFDPLVKSHIEYMDGGAGMGLSVARTICRSMGGDVTLDKTCEKGFDKGSGATFVARFPVFVTTSEVVPEDIVIRSKYCDSGERETLAKDGIMGPLLENFESEGANCPAMPNILVVDDIKLIRIMIGKMMKGLSVIPDNAENGKDAIAICKKKKFDLIIMDMIMPDMNGIDTTKMITSEGSLNEGTPVIAITASLDEDLRKAGTESGIRAWMSKPVGQETLYSTVCNHLGKDNLAWIKEGLSK